jgi:uncharacterized protein (TIGR02271 family)
MFSKFVCFSLVPVNQVITIMSSENPVVIDNSGVRATIEKSGPAETGEAYLSVRTEDGLTLAIRKEKLTEVQPGILKYRGRFDDPELQRGADRSTDSAVIPVMQEELQVGKRVIETGRVRINKTVDERVEVVDEPLVIEDFDIERVPVNRVIDKPAEVEYEGDTVLLPVMEEELVVEKRLILKEIIRVTRRKEKINRPQRVRLRSEEVTVERIDGEQSRVEDEERPHHKSTASSQSK